MCTVGAPVNLTAEVDRLTSKPMHEFIRKVNCIVRNDDLGHLLGKVSSNGWYNLPVHYREVAQHLIELRRIHEAMSGDAMPTTPTAGNPC